MSSKRKAPSDGGAAFPIPSILQGTDKNGFREVVGVPLNGRGMSLRDYFAGQALAGMLADPEERPGPKESDAQFLKNMCEGAYTYADAMLAARAREASK